MADCLIQVTAGVIAQRGRVLVCQRPAGGHHPGKWEFPGGKVEPGENLPDGMRRELQEELGIAAEIGTALWCSKYQYPGRAPFTLPFFAIRAYRGTVTNHCFADMRWVPVAALSALDFLEGDREFITRVQSGGVHLGESRRVEDHNYSRCRSCPDQTE